MRTEFSGSERRRWRPGGESGHGAGRARHSVPAGLSLPPSSSITFDCATRSPGLSRSWQRTRSRESAQCLLIGAFPLSFSHTFPLFFFLCSFILSSARPFPGCSGSRRFGVHLQLGSEKEWRRSSLSPFPSSLLPPPTPSSPSSPSSP